MLKIVQIPEATELNPGLPQSYKVNFIDEFQPGMLAQLKTSCEEDSDLLALCGVSDGTAVCGIIDDIRARNKNTPWKNDDSTLGSERITVWNCPGMIFQTDQINSPPAKEIWSKPWSVTGTPIFDIFLYCDQFGKFTSVQPIPNKKPIAKLIKIIDNGIEAEWL